MDTERKEIYSKQDAVMTHGLAIVCMLSLHLFCRKGADVYGTPLIWLSSEKPLVYCFGFFAEICVPLYTICAGYAQQLMEQKHKNTYLRRLSKVWCLLKNYWIVLVIFCGLGLLKVIVLKEEGVIPGNLTLFLKSVVLLHSYNGAWWYLNTYIFLMLIPSIILMFPVRKFDWRVGLLACFLCDITIYVAVHFSIIPTVVSDNAAIQFVYKEFYNLLGILPWFFAGSFLCKGNVFYVLDDFFREFFPDKRRNKMLLFCLFLIFIGMNILEKVILQGICGVCVFVIFNLFQKNIIEKNIFLFLGKHSTNIWLTHMFFYLVLFDGLVQTAKYPLLIFMFLLGLCVLSSFMIMKIQMVCTLHNKKQKLMRI